MRGFCALGVAALMITSISVARANDMEDARAAFREGLSLLDQERYAEAAAAFERSVAAYETAPAYYNLGLALRSTGRVLAAIDALSRASTHGDVTDQVRADAISLIAELRPLLAHVRLELAGEPDELLVDGVHHEVAAVVPLVLDPGTHTFRASRAGHASAEEEATLEPGATVVIRLDAGANPELVALSIDVEPPDASISINGEVVGDGDMRTEYAAGAHQVQVTREGYEPEEREIELVLGTPQSVLFELDRISRARRWWLWTLVGAVTVAAVSAIAVVATRPPGLDDGTTGEVFSTLGSPERD